MLHSKLWSAKTNKKLQDLELQPLILCNISRKMHFYNNNRYMLLKHSSPWIKSTVSKQCFALVASPRSSTQPWWTAPKTCLPSSRSSWTDCKLVWWANSINNNSINNHSWLCFRAKSSSSSISIINMLVIYTSDFRVCPNSTQGCSLRLIKIRWQPRISCNCHTWCSRPLPTDRNQLNLVHLAANFTLISNSSKWINKLILCKIWLVGNKT